MIVSYPAGGANDLVARSVSTAMERALNATVIVDNRSGAAGVIGAEAAAKAPPDGYTLYMMSSAQVLAPSLRKTLPYDPVRDFTAIALSARSSYVLAVHPSVPLKTMAELIGYAKANPGKLNYASGGLGSAQHLTAELFRLMAGIQIVHVPFKGAVNVPEIIAGRVQMLFSGLPQGVPHVQAGRLRALGVTTATRSSVVPNVPTIAEAGVPGFDVTIWYGVLATGGTPKDVIEKLNAGFVNALRSPDVRQQLTALGLDPVGNPAAEFSAKVRSEIAQWAKVVKQAGIKVE
jgi:tripartite-type tricarboxylate transporter receptor subunit TctC